MPRIHVRPPHLVAAAFALLPLVAPSWALQYRDFPPELQKILDERLDDVNGKAGACVAGRVRFGDAKPILNGEGVKVNLSAGGDYPLEVFNDGWFILRRALSAHSASQDSIVSLRAFDYEPIDDKGRLTPGAITYLEYVMKPTDRRSRASVKGQVVDENNAPVGDAVVTIGFPGASIPYSSETGYTEPAKMQLSGKDGSYSFSDLSPGKYTVVASKSGFATDVFRTELEPGEAKELTLFSTPNMQLEIEYVYQPDGSTRFDGGSARSGRLVWPHGVGGLDFSDGRIEQYDKDSLRDLEFTQKDGELLFDIFYHGRLRNGFYDAGAVSFQAVREAATSGFTTKAKPCVQGHVYVVRTYEGHYAKLVVLGIVAMRP